MITPIPTYLGVPYRTYKTPDQVIRNQATEKIAKFIKQCFEVTYARNLTKVKVVTTIVTGTICRPPLSPLDHLVVKVTQITHPQQAGQTQPQIEQTLSEKRAEELARIEPKFYRLLTTPDNHNFVSPLQQSREKQRGERQRETLERHEITVGRVSFIREKVTISFVEWTEECKQALVHLSTTSSYSSLLGCIIEIEGNLLMLLNDARCPRKIQERGVELQTMCSNFAKAPFQKEIYPYQDEVMAKFCQATCKAPSVSISIVIAMARLKDINDYGYVKKAPHLKVWYEERLKGFEACFRVNDKSQFPLLCGWISTTVEEIIMHIKEQKNQEQIETIFFKMQNICIALQCRFSENKYLLNRFDLTHSKLPQSS